MSNEQSRIIAVNCEGPYTIEYQFDTPADPNNEVIKNYEDVTGKLLTVDCPFLIAGMCHNLFTRGKIEEVKDRKGKLKCIHLNQVTVVK